MEKKIGQLYQKDSGEFYPKTHTGAVLTPDGRTAEQRNSDQMSDIEGKLSGKGSSASAAQYPMLFLGSFNSLGEANAKLNQVYNSTEWKYQGRLRLSVNSVTLWVEQYAINVTQGMWMQVAYGPFAPSADGSALVAEQGKAHVSFRMYNGHVNRAWTDFATNGLSLKTINGQSIIGSGDIHIEGGGSAVTIDPSIDETSEHAVQNKAIAKAIADLNAAIEGITQAEGGVVMVDFWAGTQPSTANDGDMFYNTSARKLFKMEHGDWVEQTLAEDCMYVAKPSGTLYRWEGDAMTSLYLALENRLRSLELNAVTQGDVDSMIAEELDGRGVLDASKMKTIGGVSVVKSGSDTNIPMKTINGNELIGSGDITVEGGSGGCPIEPALWSSNYQDKDDWEVGDYWFNTAESNLYRCTDPHGEFEHVNKPCMLLFQDATYTYPYPGTIFRVADENNVSGNVAVNSIEIAGKTVQLKTINGQGIVGSGNIVIEGNEPTKLYSNSDSVLYPEHFGAKGDGIDFYDWPLVCFGGTTNEALTDGGTLAGVYVPAPGDRLFGEIKNIAVDEAKGQLVYSKDAKGLSLTSADVVYSSASNKFFLRYNGSYYSRWGNSYIWNDETNNQPRIDTVYSDISLDEESTRFRQAKRISYVYRPSAGTINGHAYSAGMVDIDTLMTDDTEAFYTWLNRAKNGCALRLTKGKIYYVRPKSSSASPLFENVDFKGNEVDFGGAVIFARRSDAGWPHNSHWEGNTFIGNTASYAVPWLIKLCYCRNLTLKNVTVRALADRDVSCPASGSYALLSASSGAMNFIEIGGLEQKSGRDVSLYNENIRLVNINLRNMYHDILIGVYYSEDQLRSLTVDGWKSTGACGNTLRGRKIQISHADITTKKYLGGAGFHVFYVQERVRDCVMRDSIFRQPDMFNEVGMAFHYLDYGNLVFEGCHFEMGRFTYGGTSACSIDFRGCTFKQITKYYLGSGALQLNDGGAFVLSRIKYKFDNTVIHLISQRGFDCSSAQTLTLLDTSVLYPEPDANEVYTQPVVVLFYNFSGTAIVKHFTTNYRAAIGINTNDYDAEQRALISHGIVTTNDRIDAIRGLVSGDVEIVDGDPLNPAVNDVWYNTKAEETRKCTTAGEPAVVGWNIRKLSAFAEAYTGLSTLLIAPKESIAFDYADLTKEKFHGFLREVLTKNGYVEVFDKETLRSGEAKFYLHVPTGGDTNYLMIRTKTAGVNVDSISSTGYSSESDPRPFFNTYARRRGTSEDRVYWAMDGSPFQYTTDLTPSGLLPKVEKLEQSSGLALVPDFVQTTAPQATAGQTWFDTANGVIKRYNGNTWVGADGEGVTRVVYANSKLYLCVASNVVKEIALNDLPNS